VFCFNHEKRKKKN